MSRKTKLFLLILTAIFIVAAYVVKTSKPAIYKKRSSALYDTAISAAIDLYKARINQKIDMSSGPCLTNDLMPGWVVDIVHSPRELIDDLPENQCPAYLEGRAENFVELDTGGNLVRVR